MSDPGPAYVVPFNRWGELRMLAIGLPLTLACGGALWALGSPGSQVRFMGWVLLGAGALLVVLSPIAIARILRAKVALGFDRAGITDGHASLPWSQVKEIVIVRSNLETSLAIVPSDPGAVRSQLGGLRRFTQNLDTRLHGVEGAVFIPARMLAVPIDAVIGWVQECAGGTVPVREHKVTVHIG